MSTFEKVEFMKNENQTRVIIRTWKQMIQVQF